MGVKTNRSLIYANECYQLMGIVFAVFNKLGFGHKEAIYQKALANEFRASNISYQEQLRCKLRYKGEDLGIYVLDFLVFDKIILELKQRSFISGRDISQLYRYLKATHLKLGLIITFTAAGVRYKRIVNLEHS